MQQEITTNASPATTGRTFKFYTTGGTKFTVVANNRKQAREVAFGFTGETITNRNHPII